MESRAQVLKYEDSEGESEKRRDTEIESSIENQMKQEMDEGYL